MAFDLDAILRLDTTQFHRNLRGATESGHVFAQRFTSSIAKAGMGIFTIHRMAGEFRAALAERENLLITDEEIERLELAERLMKRIRILWLSSVGSIIDKAMKIKIGPLAVGRELALFATGVESEQSSEKEAKEGVERLERTAAIQKERKKRQEELEKEASKGSSPAPQISRIDPDTLARIGGFVGAGPDQRVRLERDQLEQLRRIAREVTDLNHKSSGNIQW